MTSRSFTVAEVAELERTTPETIRHLIRAGRIQARRLDPTKRNSPYRISERALDRYRGSLV